MSLSLIVFGDFTGISSWGKSIPELFPSEKRGSYVPVKIKP